MRRKQKATFLKASKLSEKKSHFTKPTKYIFENFK